MMAALPPLALSVRQPWAWAIIYAGKDIENRDWRHGRLSRFLNQRGRVAIHASKGMRKHEYESSRKFIMGLGVECPAPRDHPSRAIRTIRAPNCASCSSAISPPEVPPIATPGCQRRTQTLTRSIQAHVAEMTSRRIAIGQTNVGLRRLALPH
jgi:hypothetical protein